ncbi:MAG: PIN domain-containing protein [Planctomycetota bacterium]|nr:PIN domain-containing protein [Planctomycetota bacterium]
MNGSRTSYLFVDTCIYRACGFDPHAGPLATLKRLVTAADVTLVVTTALERELSRQLEDCARAKARTLEDALRSAAKGVLPELKSFEIPADLIHRIERQFLDYLSSLHPFKLDSDTLPFARVQERVYQLSSREGTRPKPHQYCDVANSIILAQWVEMKDVDICVVSTDNDWSLILEDHPKFTVRRELPSDGTNDSLLQGLKAWVNREKELADRGLKDAVRIAEVHDSVHGWRSHIDEVLSVVLGEDSGVLRIEDPADGVVTGTIEVTFEADVVVHSEHFYEVNRKGDYEMDVKYGSTVVSGLMWVTFWFDVAKGPGSATYDIDELNCVAFVNPSKIEWERHW